MRLKMRLGKIPEFLPLNIEQDLLVSKILPTKRTMFKDEDVCLHCGLCAERCPTGAWDMQTFLYEEAKVYS